MHRPSRIRRGIAPRIQKKSPSYPAILVSRDTSERVDDLLLPRLRLARADACERATIY